MQGSVRRAESRFDRSSAELQTTAVDRNTQPGIDVDAGDDTRKQLHESTVTRARSMQVRGGDVCVPAARADPDATRLHVKAANKKRIVSCMLLDACSKHFNVISSMPSRRRDGC